VGPHSGKGVGETNERLDDLRSELSRRIVESEVRTSTAITDLAGTVRDLTGVLRAQADLRPRVEKCERDIDDLRRRVNSVRSADARAAAEATEQPRADGGLRRSATSSSSRTKCIDPTSRDGDASTFPSGRTVVPSRSVRIAFFEILSASNRRDDTVEKFRVYQRAGVPHYWLADPDEQSLTVHRWTKEGYLVALRAVSGETVRAEPFDAIELRVSELLGLDDG
jgi:hypothetical protein